MTIRSCLFVPCDNHKAMQKAKSLSADALIFDLEDAIGPNGHFDALQSLLNCLAHDEFAAPFLSVRINIDYMAEIAQAIAPFVASNKIQAIIIPKVKSSHELSAHIAALNAIFSMDHKLAYWAMIETPSAIANLDAICRDNCALGLTGLILGPNDLRQGLGCGSSPSRLELAYAMGALIINARVYGLMSLDGVYNQYGDDVGFEKECQQGALLGFDGKTLIHPTQIKIAEVYFNLSTDQIAWAKCVVDAFSKPESQNAGIVSVNGAMVERLHLRQAKKWLGQLD